MITYCPTCANLLLGARLFGRRRAARGRRWLGVAAARSPASDRSALWPPAAVEMTDYSKELRYFCQSCPYMYNIDRKVSCLRGRATTTAWPPAAAGRVCSLPSGPGSTPAAAPCRARSWRPCQAQHAQPSTRQCGAATATPASYRQQPLPWPSAQPGPMPSLAAPLPQITKRAALNQKQVDDVLGGEDAWKNVQKTDGGRRALRLALSGPVQCALLRIGCDDGKAAARACVLWAAAAAVAVWQPCPPREPTCCPLPRGPSPQPRAPSASTTRRTSWRSRSGLQTSRPRSSTSVCSAPPGGARAERREGSVGEGSGAGGARACREISRGDAVW